ncbi:MAG: 4Fe-4S binding protein [Chloroflexota bacterium]|nr:4Fe-4S binding protein [Chloroflexota bacterium]PLS79691.1 MAG: 4Fe-4S ferredoxin [Chloroflexota bacterium]
MTATPEQTTATQTALQPVGGGGVVVVERKQPGQSYGQGIAKGMAVVIRHFAKSFTSRIDDKSDQAGMFTVEYPEERMELPEAYRNMPVLLYDDKTGQELCTSCFQCERICPPKVIHITQAKDPNTGKAVPAAEEFIIEYDSCMSCGLCHEICPFDAIKMDHFYELSTHDHLAMDQNKAALDRPISYYQAIAPNLWAAVEANAMKKLQNNVKRRPGNIGVAPHMIGKTQKALPTAAAAGAGAAAAARPKTPVAAIGKNMSPEKVARLEAIRAAKRGGATMPGESEIVAPSPVASGESGLHVAESQAGLAPSPATTPAPATGPVAAVGQSMSDEKKARLEAIRAAKRAQGGGQ